ncbi:MAG: hypothetical protein JO353_02215 [Phycisphaerae bacterium]|nr:hypothetical protein [Phycisphaerae bacterium]
MIESEPGGLLMTWRSPVWPIERETALTRLADHRRDYLQYEGEISGNRGTVRRVASGWTTSSGDGYLVDRTKITYRNGSWLAQGGPAAGLPPAIEGKNNSTAG